MIKKIGKFKSLCYLLLCISFVFISLGCTERGDYEIKCWKPEVQDGAVVIKVMVKSKHPENLPYDYLKVVLSDPEGNTIDKRDICKEDLIDGIETVRLYISRYYSGLLKPGTYTVTVIAYRYTKERPYLVLKTLYKKTFYFEKGVNVTVKDVKFEIKYWSHLDEYYINKILLSIENTGDLPAFIDKAVIMIGNKIEELPYLNIWIPPDRTKQISGYVYITGLVASNLKETPVIIKLYSKDTEVISYKTKLNYTGPKIVVKDVKFETTYWKYSNEYSINKVILTVTNCGDLPTYISKLLIIVDGKQDDASVFNSKEILPNTTVGISSYISIYDLPPGIYKVTIKLYSTANVELASYETQLSLKS